MEGRLPYDDFPVVFLPPYESPPAWVPPHEVRGRGQGQGRGGGRPGWWQAGGYGPAQLGPGGCGGPRRLTAAGALLCSGCITPTTTTSSPSSCHAPSS